MMMKNFMISGGGSGNAVIWFAALILDWLVGWQNDPRIVLFFSCPPDD
jgi:hypothetical protein